MRMIRYYYHTQFQDGKEGVLGSQEETLQLNENLKMERKSVKGEDREAIIMPCGIQNKRKKKQCDLRAVL